jgi:hypothetical protein
MKAARFTDWNSFLGTVIFSLMALGVSVGAYLNPDFFSEDPRLMAKLIPFVGPIIAAVALYRLVVYVDFGPRIVFRRILGRHEYDWNQLKGLGTREATKRYFFGLIKFTHEFLVFAVEDQGKVHEFAYRVSRKKRPILEQIVNNHSKNTRYEYVDRNPR